MSNRDSCTHHFEHVKQTRPFTEREYMQCTKCGHQNPLGLFQTWDTQRDGPAVKADLNKRDGIGWNINKGRTSGPHLQWIKNTTGKIEDIYTREEWGKANPPLRPDSSYGAKYLERRYGKKRRTPIVKVQKTQTGWLWTCRICDHFFMSTKWSIIIKSATHHAHNHH